MHVFYQVYCNAKCRIKATFHNVEHGVCFCVSRSIYVANVISKKVMKTLTILHKVNLSRALFKQEVWQKTVIALHFE